MHLSVDDARRRALDLGLAARVGTESVELDRLGGRILAEDIVVPDDLPPFANSAMDGYAVRGAELPTSGEGRFRLAGTVLAGASAAPAFGDGECVRITTGAPLPPGADTVVIKENVTIDGDSIVIRSSERAGANVRPAGEDYHAGDVAFKKGTALSPAQVAVLAAAGRTGAIVAQRPRVALFVTGDELVPSGEPLGFGQIHDSNRYSLGGLLRGLGIEAHPVMHLRDDPVRLRAAFRNAADHCDLLLSSGGVSAGEADLLPGIVADLGTIHFWKVRMRPGMPLLCGQIGGALVFGLPGNPVSTIATFLVLVRPVLLAMQRATNAAGRVWRARLAAPVLKKHDRCEFLRARIDMREDATLWATPMQKQGSGMLRGVVDADALIMIPENAHELAQGSVVDLLPLPGLF
ncbi:MAG: gephyrin-like molybdotransferase Glp [Dokdonella sp.]|uniref:molybdopterin molybdotransferase MoeA n=1 Tax=Dokdonella sp. TaxID=2291710 RepID=UPI003265DC53